MKIIKNEELLEKLKNMEIENSDPLLNLIMTIANSGALDKCEGIKPKTQKDEVKPIMKTSPEHKRETDFKEKMLKNFEDGTKIVLSQEKNEKRIEQLKKEIIQLEFENKELDKELADLINKKEEIILEFIGLK